MKKSEVGEKETLIEEEKNKQRLIFVNKKEQEI